MQRRTLLTAASASFAANAFSATIPPLSKHSIGLTLPLTSSQGEVARELEAGYRLAIQDAPSFSLTVMDDESKPAKVAANLRALGKDSSVIAFSGIVGTPHAESGIPVARELAIPLVGIRSGARSVRDGLPGVYHLRASFEEEIAKLVTMCVNAGISSVSIIFSNDSFGIPLQKYAVAALAEAGISLLAVEPVDRTGDNLAAATKSVSTKVRSTKGSTAIALFLITATMVEAAKQIRDAGVVMPIFAMSFTGTKTVASQNVPHLAGLGFVSAFPLPRVSYLQSAVAFRAAAVRAKSPDLIPSLTAFEGFFYGSVIVKAASGGREGFAKQLNSGIEIWGGTISFPASPAPHAMVGSRYLELVYKNQRNGMLQS